MVEHPAPLLIAAVTGASATVMQSAVQASPAVSMLVPIISAVVGGAISYGILKGAVHSMEREVSRMRSDLGQVYDLIREFSTRIGHIEGRLDER
jgi:hypothetical protein